MSRYGQKSRLTGISGANTINYWLGGGFATLPVAPTSVEYLVIAGGGSNGQQGYPNGTGGGGAGGYRTSNSFGVSSGTP